MYEWGRFPKPWQMTQTQEIINHRVLKIHEWIWGDVYEWGNISQGMTSDR